MMANIGHYLSSCLIEGIVFGILFWVVVLITVESTDLLGALKAALVAEAIGNLPYLAGHSAIDPSTLLTTLVGLVVFVRMILKIGELTAFKAIYGAVMTYFALTALYTCSA